MKTAAIFPGQGSQAVGMGRDFYERSPPHRSMFDRANSVLGFDLAQVCFEGPAAKLEQTDLQQPAIFVVSVAVWEAFLEAGGSTERFQQCAGLSLGEYTALYAAGCLSFEDGLRLVRRRGELMQRAAESIPSGMVSLLGATEETAHALCEKARQSDVLVPANFNCPGQVVIAGTKAACERAAAMAEDFGCRAIPLPVAGAFHTPIMASAAEGLSAALDATNFAPLKLEVVANVDARPHSPDAASIRMALRRQLTQPVLWQRSVERMIADGVERFVELGPGRVLTGLMRKINRAVTAINISSFEAVGAGLTELSSGDRVEAGQAR